MIYSVASEGDRIFHSKLTIKNYAQISLAYGDNATRHVLQRNQSPVRRIPTQPILTHDCSGSIHTIFDAPKRISPRIGDL